MSNYQPKKLKFHGEDKFMCRKKNTKQRYLMATAETDLGKFQEAVDTVPLEQATVINPSAVTTDAVATTNTPPVLITEPNWDAMDCKTILIEIQTIQDMLMVSKFTQDVRDQYDRIIADGKAAYTRKCEVVTPEPTPHAPPALEVPEPTPTPSPTPTPPPTISVPPTGTTTITTTGVPIISTGTAGGTGIVPPKSSGGGGGGATTPTGVKPQKKINWLLIGAVALGAYLLLRRK